MTKRDFLLSIPDIIQHPTHGYAELEIVSDDDTKTACYRHPASNFSSGSNHGKTWAEVSEKINNYLKDNPTIQTPPFEDK